MNKARPKTYGREKAKHWSMRLVRNDNSAPPLTVQVREGIRRQILDGTLAAGDALIPQRQLCKILDINHVTLTQAINDLIKEGLLRSEHGRGIFINKLTPPCVGIVYRGALRLLQESPVYGVVNSEAVRVLTQGNVRVTHITGEAYAPELRFGPALEKVLNADVDAYLTIGIQNDEYLSMLSQSGRFLVAADATPTQNDFNAVICDSFREGYLAARHLVDNGHRQIVFVGEGRGHHPADPEKHILIPEPDSMKRMAGYLFALTEAGIEHDFQHAFERFPAEGTAAQARLRRLIENREVTAAIVLHPRTAAWIAERADVPREISVVCFGQPEKRGRDWTCCSSDMAGVGKRAAERVLALLARRSGEAAKQPEDSPALITVAPKFIAGNTVRKIGDAPAHLHYHRQQLAAHAGPQQ
ncbi:MAG TPA: GntR family transcriptional regulator [Planctomycetota bacterium]|nr:GntR family transcriptional regulator [Planctomycetota bacterium]